ncbi:hypothetical protein KY290_011962 [Solanum tuberosum]|uniref:Uncharacterized protein n=1 Tax=Solanum tuberosum TaxID=4113 RepID=A0ABQ7W4C5_SOLTU|nr:hypothetical protein KY289_012482 [Solanum tuberosum]KAH0710621.1 hypothetical protein KY284_012048 [Solanum tuberosum]KAH0736290.1 hypothetical protein KY285_011997 [Solanum tuberosum]KAH0774825.1 hypothetical protein KY290_011962 [Solanum tuberosum]
MKTEGSFPSQQRRSQSIIGFHQANYHYLGKPDFEAQLSPGLRNRAKERCPGSRDPELLGGEGEPYPITHFSHGGQAKKTHLKSYQGREGSQLSNWNIHWA